MLGRAIELDRRRFLLLCGAVAPGIWFSDVGLVRIPPAMVPVLAEACSFCGGLVSTCFGLAGVLPRSGAICPECVDLCREILLPGESPENADELPELEFSSDEIPPAVLNDPYFKRVSENLATGMRDPNVEALIILAKTLEPDLYLEIRKELDFGESKVWPDSLSCSFCDTCEDETEKLIVGSEDVLICDGCVRAAATMFARVGWKPEA